MTDYSHPLLAAGRQLQSVICNLLYRLQWNA